MAAERHDHPAVAIMRSPLYSKDKGGCLPTSLSGTTGNSQHGSSATLRMLQLSASRSMEISHMRASERPVMLANSICRASHNISARNYTSIHTQIG